MLLDGIVDHAGPGGGGDVRAKVLWRLQESLDCVLTNALVIADILSHRFMTAVHEVVKHDKRRYRRLSRIEIMFGCLTDWRRFAARYDRCPTAFFSAVALAATVIFSL